MNFFCKEKQNESLTCHKKVQTQLSRRAEPTVSALSRLAVTQTFFLSFFSLIASCLNMKSHYYICHISICLRCRRQRTLKRGHKKAGWA